MEHDDIYPSLGLPRNFFQELDIHAFNKLGCEFACSEEKFLRYIQGKDVALLLFGVSSKKIRNLFAQAGSDVWLWASALSDANADRVQAMLSLTETIPYAPPVLPLMSPLSFETKFRLIQATTFKYRGVEDKVDWEILRSTAQLWRELGEPDIRQFGRIRCWFSLREDLRKALDTQMPCVELLQPTWLEEIHGGRWSISVPKTSIELRARAMELRNCLGSLHVENINDGYEIVLIICENGEATHALNILTKSKEISEFVSYRNGKPDPQIEEEVIAALKKVGVIA